MMSDLEAGPIPSVSGIRNHDSQLFAARGTPNTYPRNSQILSNVVTNDILMVPLSELRNWIKGQGEDADAAKERSLSGHSSARRKGHVSRKHSGPREVGQASKDSSRRGRKAESLSPPLPRSSSSHERLVLSLSSLFFCAGTFLLSFPLLLLLLLGRV